MTDKNLSRAFFFQGQKSEVGVLLLHGFSGSPADMRELGEYLAGHGFTVAGWRLPGHVTSPDDLNRMTAEDWLNSVVQGMNHLEKWCQSNFIVGFSFGGNLALEASSLNLVKPQGIVTVNTPMFFPQEYFHRFINPMASLMFKSIKKPWVKPEKRADYERRGKYTVIPLRALQRMYRLVVKTRQSIKLVRQPIMIIQSRLDAVVKPTSARFIHQTIGSGEKELVWADNSRHSYDQGLDKEMIFKKILTFILTKSHDSNNSSH
ncbi:MAG: alpha/beta fold hydrolase [Patescibacteria group bacterium]|nr:alpha/beta fold hydrolase [Patescibacteria group bacterium]